MVKVGLYLCVWEVILVVEVHVQLEDSSRTPLLHVHHQKPFYCVGLFGNCHDPLKPIHSCKNVLIGCGSVLNLECTKTGMFLGKHASP